MTAAFVVSLGLAACGGDAGTADTAGAVPAPTETTTAPDTTETTAAPAEETTTTTKAVETDDEPDEALGGIAMGSGDSVELGGFDYDGSSYEATPIVGEILNCEPTSNPEESLFVQVRGDGVAMSINVIKGSTTTHLIQVYEEGIGLFRASASAMASVSGNDEASRWFETVGEDLVEIDGPLFQVSDERVSGSATVRVDGADVERTITFDLAIPAEQLPTEACSFS